MEQRIIIFGNSGSGKSWLASKLSNELGINHTKLDDIFWEDSTYSSKRDDKEIYKDLNKISSTSHWIIEGVYGDLISDVIEHANSIIFLDLPWSECKEGLRIRNLDSPNRGNYQELVAWAREYETRTSPSSKTSHHKIYDEFPGKKQIIHSKVKLTEFANNIEDIIEN